MPAPYSNMPTPSLDPELARQIPSIGVLGPLKRAQLAQYLELVAQYAPVLNLTAFRGAAELARELGAESLRLLELGPIPDGWRCADLGSGVGTPVVPLAIACSRAHTPVGLHSPTGVSAPPLPVPPQFVAIESRAKRCDFLRMVVAQVHIANLTVLEQRTKQLIADAPASFDLVTARAYAQPDVLCAHAASLLKPGGELRGYTGAVMAEVECATQAHRFAILRVLPYSVGDSQRHVYLLKKAGA